MLNRGWEARRWQDDNTHPALAGSGSQHRDARETPPGKSAHEAGRHEAGEGFVNGGTGADIEKLPRMEDRIVRTKLDAPLDAICRTVVCLWSGHYVR